MVRAGALPRLLHFLPECSPSDLQNLQPCPEGFGCSSSPSKPRPDQLLSLTPQTTKSSTPFTPRPDQLLSLKTRKTTSLRSNNSCTLTSTPRPDQLISLKTRKTTSLRSTPTTKNSCTSTSVPRLDQLLSLKTHKATKRALFVQNNNDLSPQDVAVMSLLFFRCWEGATKCEATQQPLVLKAVNLVRLMRKQWKPCGVRLKAGKCVKQVSNRFEFDGKSLLQLVSKYRSNTKGRTRMKDMLQHEMQKYYRVSECGCLCVSCICVVCLRACACMHVLIILSVGMYDD